MASAQDVCALCKTDLMDAVQCKDFSKPVCWSCVIATQGIEAKISEALSSQEVDEGSSIQQSDSTYGKLSLQDIVVSEEVSSQTQLDGGHVTQQITGTSGESGYQDIASSSIEEATPSTSSNINGRREEEQERQQTPEQQRQQAQEQESEQQKTEHDAVMKQVTAIMEQAHKSPAPLQVGRVQPLPT